MQKLNFELVPEGCWYNNLRSILSKKQWDYIKKTVKAKANGKCMICGKQTDKLEAHEQWEYNKNTKTQKLVGIVAICKDCHQTIHIGRTSLFGDASRAEDHYMKVNGVSYAQMKQQLSEANKRHKELNEVDEWKTDISYLKTFIET